MISPEKITHYRDRLEKTKAELLAELERNEVTEDFGSDVDDFDEEKNEAEALGNQLAQNQQLRIRINEIDEALNNMRTGSYGTCKRCGRQIDEEVLDLVPESQLCGDCKKNPEP